MFVFHKTSAFDVKPILAHPHPILPWNTLISLQCVLLLLSNSSAYCPFFSCCFCTVSVLPLYFRGVCVSILIEFHYKWKIGLLFLWSHLKLQKQTAVILLYYHFHYSIFTRFVSGLPFCHFPVYFSLIGSNPMNSSI